MKTQPSSSIRNTSLFKLYDIENDYKKHKNKINRIKYENTKNKVKR
jgi:hypothetical protein